MLLSNVLINNISKIDSMQKKVNDE